MFDSVKGGEKPEWKFYNQMEKILCGKDLSTDQDDSINPTEKIPEESSGRQEDEDTNDWEILGHAGLEGTFTVSIERPLKTFCFVKLIFNFCSRNQECPVDRSGDANSDQDLGRGPNPARAERGSSERTHLFHDLKEDGRSRIHPDGGTVSEQNQTTQAVLQTVLRE